MRGYLLLSDFAQVDPSNKAHVNGLGWSTTNTPLPAVGLLLIVEIPWDQTNVKHTFQIDLVDGDGHAAILGLDDNGAPINLQIQGELESGRPPGVAPGTPQVAHLAINLNAGMPLVPGIYEFRVEIDGQPAQNGPSARFTVVGPGTHP